MYIPERGVLSGISVVIQDLQDLKRYGYTDIHLANRQNFGHEYYGIFGLCDGQ